MEEFVAVLSHFGFNNAAQFLPERVEGTEKSFIKWVTNELEACKKLTGESKTRFDEMRSRGSCYSKPEIVEISAAIRHRNSSCTVQLNEDIEDCVHQLEPLTSHLRLLNTVHSNLSCEYKECLKDQERLTKCLARCQREYAKANEDLKSLNTKMNEALDTLNTADSSVTGIYQLSQVGGASSCKATPTFITDSNYHQSESLFLKELTDFTKKQFSPGISEVVESLSYTDGTVLDLTALDGCGPGGCDPGLDENDAHVYKQHKEELDRLQKIIPVCEYQLVNSRVMAAYLQASVKEAEKRLSSIKKMGTNELRDSIHYADSIVADLKDRLHKQVNSRLTPLIQDLTALQVNQVLCGDHDLKLSRQATFTARQEEVIQHLNNQACRYKLLSMMVEADFNCHRNAYQLLLAVRQHLEKFNQNCKSQMGDLVGAQERCLLPADSGISKVQLQTEASLSMKESVTVSIVGEQLGLIDKGMSLYADVCCHGNTNPRQCSTTIFRSAAYEASVSNLETLLKTLEGKIKTLLKEQDRHRKALHRNPLLLTERQLFVHFFTNPQYLPHLIADLTAKIDTRALTSTVIEQY